MPQGPKGERRPRDVIGNAVHVMRIAKVQSSRRLEREAGRNVEVMWLTVRVVPDHKTIVDFRKDNGRAIHQVCFLQPAALRVLANDTDKMVARDAALIATTQNVAAGRGGGNAAQRRRPIAPDAYHSHP